MDAETIDFLRQVNNRFYTRCAASFSATRNAPWAGWRECLDVARDCGALGAAGPLRVLDVACGNMRFADFLERELPGCDVSYFAVDDCGGLVPEFEQTDGFARNFQNLDIVGGLAAADGLASSIAAPACDAVCCFGFMHHVPSFALRAQLLAALVEKAAPGGIVCVSFWQFMNDGKFAKKVEAWNAAARTNFAGRDFSALEPGDYFLGWQNEPGLWRYCHHFEQREVDALLAAACAGGSAKEIARFLADGKSGAMNCYVVLQKAR